MEASKSLSLCYQCFYFVLAVPALIIMYTDKDSNLICDLRTKYGEEVLIQLENGKLQSRKWQFLPLPLPIQVGGIYFYGKYTHLAKLHPIHPKTLPNHQTTPPTAVPSW